MELGFETIGNATLICHDNGPVLVTDPWTHGAAYFGSWTLSHDIPEEQRDTIQRCQYAWLSHGHPDHLSPESLEKLRELTILVPNHFGGRIRDDLREQGFNVHVLVDRVWTQLSPRIRVMCIPDMNQDAVLLVDVGGRLLVNLNDAGDRGWGRFVRGLVRRYDQSYLLALSGYGDADMINYFTEDGQRIAPYAAAKTPVGRTSPGRRSSTARATSCPSAPCTSTSAPTASGPPSTPPRWRTTRAASSPRRARSCPPSSRWTSPRTTCGSSAPPSAR
ncbi:hypothetical protein OWM54_18230 [Myxococcus sp. MISCRS1]|uniref:MBL fold metallo-hydrolase n=1 Tax=Myxococcus sp. MISCRS1 TaxID=2996786 RepID=UPI00226F751B|nr:hypothetical protein [Myxococcus sp. MISCRS1]MCY0999082.1 hypothetical protein [Myxococcus sp. MISCRS1]